MKTALEYLVERLAKNGILHSSDIAEANELFKQQIIDACEFGKAFGLNQAWGYYNPIVNPEQYYNKTFKSE